MWRVKILTTLPKFYSAIFNESLYVRAVNEKLWDYQIANIRDYAMDSYHTIDDTPYGGGGGMVLKADVVGDAIEDFFEPNQQIYYLSPKGKHLSQTMAREIVGTQKVLNVLCARFEGIDQRVIQKYKIVEISIGDFILTNGDLAALALIDACLRFIPGFLGNKNVHQEESFGAGVYKHLLEYPHYTKPHFWQGEEVPSILLSGHHEKILQWRLDMAKKLTKIRRPDLWQKHLKHQKDE